MNSELIEALTLLEREKKISRETILEAIRQSLIQACKNNWKTEAENVVVNIDPETCDYEVYAMKTVVEQVEDELAQISLTNAKMMDSRYELGDVVRVDIKSKEFGRIATQNAKNVILQKIREEERRVLIGEYLEKEHDIVTGVVQRYFGKNVSINLGRADATLPPNEQMRGEVYRPNQRLKVYVLEVKDAPKGPKIQVSRTHPDLVKRLFEEEVTEVRDGTVEIKAIAREAGSRTKIAVWSNNPDVDPVGACVGLNGTRVNAVVDELHGEKIDIINWDENPALLIENALSPAKVITVLADPDERSAKVVVPDYQLSLAIGKEGQNARLAARLTGFKIDIKNETQARESGDLLEYEEDYYQEEYDDYGEDYSEDGSWPEEGDYSQEGIWPEAGTDPQQEGIWPEAGADPQQEGIWPETGADPQQEGIWPEAGADPQQEGIWPETGADPQQEGIWPEAGADPQKGTWSEDSIDPEDGTYPGTMDDPQESDSEDVSAVEDGEE